MTITLEQRDQLQEFKNKAILSGARPQHAASKVWVKMTWLNKDQKKELSQAWTRFAMGMGRAELDVICDRIARTDS